MAGYGYTRNVIAKASSADSSTVTSNSILVADANTITVSITSVAAVASNWTLQGTNADGFSAAIAEGEWSNISIIAAQGIYSITPGARWVRTLRPAVNSLASIVISYRVY